METFRPHVLVVTDDPGLAGFLQEGLLLGGFWVSVVASALQTLELFRLRGFDVVVVDGGLTGIAGSELIRRLRERTDSTIAGPSRADVPIILIDEGATSVRAQEIGADEVLRPPIELEAIIPYLHGVVMSWRQAHPDRPTADEAAQWPRSTAADMTPPDDPRR